MEDGIKKGDVQISIEINGWRVRDVLGDHGL